MLTCPDCLGKYETQGGLTRHRNVCPDRRERIHKDQIRELSSSIQRGGSQVMSGLQEIRSAQQQEQERLQQVDASIVAFESACRFYFKEMHRLIRNASSSNLDLIVQDGRREARNYSDETFIIDQMVSQYTLTGAIMLNNDWFPAANSRELLQIGERVVNMIGGFLRTVDFCHQHGGTQQYRLT